MNQEVADAHQRIREAAIRDAAEATRGAQAQAAFNAEEERLRAEYTALYHQAKDAFDREWAQRWQEEYLPRIDQARQRAAQAEAAHLQQLSFDQARQVAERKAQQQQQALQQARADAAKAGMSLEEFLAARLYGGQG